MSNSYWKQFATTGLSLTKFSGVSHPSQPNYIAQIGADTLGCVNDNNIDLNATSLVTLFESHNISWKSYQEDYVPQAGGDCEPKAVIGKYHRKHNPFMSFLEISKNKAKCQKIVPASQLDADIANNQLPQFGYYTPNIDNDAHDTNLDFAGKYFQNWLNKYMSIPNFTRNTLILVTFDEDEYLEGNHIYAVLLGPYVTPGTSEGTTYTHYSITKTMEVNWGLPNLGRNDVNAHDFINAIKNAQRPTPEEALADEHVIREELSRPLPRKPDVTAF